MSIRRLSLMFALVVLVPAPGCAGKGGTPEKKSPSHEPVKTGSSPSLDEKPGAKSTTEPLPLLGRGEQREETPGAAKETKQEPGGGSPRSGLLEAARSPSTKGGGLKPRPVSAKEPPGLSAEEMAAHAKEQILHHALAEKYGPVSKKEGGHPKYLPYIKAAQEKLAKRELKGEEEANMLIVQMGIVGREVGPVWVQHERGVRVLCWCCLEREALPKMFEALAKQYDGKRISKKDMEPSLPTAARATVRGLHARDRMGDQNARALLDLRDVAQYGQPNGPTFAQLFSRQKADGKSDDEAHYDAIIKSKQPDRRERRRDGGGQVVIMEAAIERALGQAGTLVAAWETWTELDDRWLGIFSVESFDELIEPWRRDSPCVPEAQKSSRRSATSCDFAACASARTIPETSMSGAPTSAASRCGRTRA